MKCLIDANTAVLTPLIILPPIAVVGAEFAIRYQHGRQSWGDNHLESTRLIQSSHHGEGYPTPQEPDNLCKLMSSFALLLSLCITCLGGSV